jgi:hypothetical protein
MLVLLAILFPLAIVLITILMSTVGERVHDYIQSGDWCIVPRRIRHAKSEAKQLREQLDVLLGRIQLVENVHYLPHDLKFDVVCTSYRLQEIIRALSILRSDWNYDTQRGNDYYNKQIQSIKYDINVYASDVRLLTNRTRIWCHA